MIAGNFSNNFEYVPQWLWDKQVSPTEFVLYMALRSFSYPIGPTIDDLVTKTGFTRAVVEETLQSLQQAELAEPCCDQFGEQRDDRWVFTYLKYTRNAANPAPAPAPDPLVMVAPTTLESLRARLERSRPPLSRDEQWEKENVELRARLEQQGANLDNPTYLRSPGPINPDIVDMVDTIKQTYYVCGAEIAEAQYKLGELTGLGLLDPDANDDLQRRLVDLGQNLYHGTLATVRDPNSDDMYWDEFDNTYSDGREIKTQIRIERWEDSEGACEFNRFIHGDGVINDFPRGVIYHINPVPANE